MTVDQSCLKRSNSDSFSSLLSLTTVTGKDEKEKYLLPLPASQKSKIRVRVRALLGHCLYRRVIIWSVTVLLVTCLTLFTSGVHTKHGRILDLVDFRKGGSQQSNNNDNNNNNNNNNRPVVDTSSPSISSQSDGKSEVETQEEEERETEKAQKEEENRMPHWLQYKHLDGYFNGLKALVPKANHTPEYPRKPTDKSPFPLTISYSGMPTPTPFVPQPDYKSSMYTSKYHEVKTCYIDENSRVPAPDLYAYDGVVQGAPNPVIGSYNLLGIRDDVCFDRFGRYGPYGLGYSQEEGGSGEGRDIESGASEEVWSKTGKIDYSKVDWGDAQNRCYNANKQRFVEYDDNGNPKVPLSDSTSSLLPDTRRDRPQTGVQPEREKLERIAVVIRTYVGFQWTQHAILNFRAMISELALRSGGEYAVHFLLHVRDNEVPIWADAETAQKVLDDNVPAEFHSICTLWSEDQMRLLYPGEFGDAVENPSNGDIHGVYRSAHMPLQHFALTHPQFAHFWNWEMDMRWLGNYYELFDRLGAWARNQSRQQIWERSQKYYIPEYHGSWENFTETVNNETEASGRRAIMGPVLFAGRQMIRNEERGGSFMPGNCARGSDMAQCGVGEEADLITLNPLFDAEESGWVFAQDVTGYDHSYSTPPRRCAIVTASRLSRRLLQTMHEETWRHHHSMFSEMYPASMALHHGLKAAYAPHPVYLDRAWDLDWVDKAFNGGRDHSTSGHGSPFDFRNEHNHKGTSWYYNSEFAGLMWRRWLGYAQMDGRGMNGGRAGEGSLKGGKDDEEKPSSTGRMCLRSMLVHPIKWEHPNERS